jgi:hypothetical protein
VLNLWKDLIAQKGKIKKYAPTRAPKTKTGAPAFELRFDFRHLMSESDVGTRFSFV